MSDEGGGVDEEDNDGGEVSHVEGTEEVGGGTKEEEVGSVAVIDGVDALIGEGTALVINCVVPCTPTTIAGLRDTRVSNAQLRYPKYISLMQLSAIAAACTMGARVESSLLKMFSSVHLTSACMVEM